MLKTQATEIIRSAVDLYKLDMDDLEIDTLGEFIVTHFEQTFKDVIDDFSLKVYTINGEEYVKVDKLMEDLQGLTLLYLANETLMFHILKQHT